MRRVLTIILLQAAYFLALFCIAVPVGIFAREYAIGSKTFTESVILGEILTQRLRTSAPARHIAQLGGTRILWNALQKGDIDAYPEYTGTIIAEILAGMTIRNDNDLRNELQKRGIGISRTFGFANTYALGVTRRTAQELGLQNISDLVRHPALRFAFSNEFMDRHDGWLGLQAAYGLPQKDVRGLEHDLAYRALASGTIDLTELYSTDAEIALDTLHILRDDRHYFPDYRAVILYRLDMPPEVHNILLSLENRIAQETMTAMNAQAKRDKTPESLIASRFLTATFGKSANTQSDAENLTQRILRRTWEHLSLVAVSLLSAILVAIPLGVAAQRLPRVGFVVLGAAGVMQTIPSLALLVLMIPLLGIGAIPAVAALFLYSILPVLRGTVTGLETIPTALRESAEVLGLPPSIRLWRIELPLALPVILSGIKTAAVLNVGTATLGALIGAGGHGQPIMTGIRLADTAQILEGAIPAALLALAVQGVFELLERWAVPPALRVGRS